LDPKEVKVLLDLRVLEVLKVLLDHKDHKVLLDLKVLKVLQEHLLLL
jgi:hypothetical protein